MAIPPIATLYLNQGHEGEHFARALLDVIRTYVPSECPEDSSPLYIEYRGHT